MKLTLVNLALAASVLALTACGGGGGSGSQPEPDFPLRPETARLFNMFDEMSEASRGQPVTDNMPTNGTAEFKGVFSTTEPVRDHRLVGDVALSANLTSGTIGGRISNIQMRSDTHDATAPADYLSLDGVIEGSELRGNVGGNFLLIGSVTGTFDGNFLGPDGQLISAGVLGTATRSGVSEPFIGQIEAATVR